MSDRKYHFTATITVTRGRKSEPLKGTFVFGPDGRRAVPMQIEGESNLNTVSIQIEGPRIIPSGESFTAPCRVSYEKYFRERLVEGTQFVLWDGGAFADGIVQTIYWENWA